MEIWMIFMPISTPFGQISAVGPPAWTAFLDNKPVITKFSASDQLLTSHVFWISSERHVTNSYSMSEINYHGEITPGPRIEPVTSESLDYKSDTLPIALTGQTKVWMNRCTDTFACTYTMRWLFADLTL